MEENPPASGETIKIVWFDEEAPEEDSEGGDRIENTPWIGLLFGGTVSGN